MYSIKHKHSHAFWAKKGPERLPFIARYPRQARLEMLKIPLAIREQYEIVPVRVIEHVSDVS